MKHTPLPKTVVKVDRLLGILTEKIRSGELPPGSTLPPLRKLADLFDVSVGTVQRCFRILENEGLIESRPQSRVLVKGEPPNGGAPDAPQLAEHKPKAERIAETLIDSIANGELRSGSPLPMQKALRFQFGTTHSTLKAALEIVLQKGLIHRKGNAYFAGSQEVRRHYRNLKVYFIPAKSWLSGRFLPHRFGGRLLYPIERELAEFGVSLAPTVGGLSDKDRIGRAKDSLGFCYIGGAVAWAGNVAGDKPELMEKEMLRISQFGQRVVILNAGGIFSRFPKFSFRKFPRVFALGLDSFQAGEDTARYLATMGHRNVAYFSYSSDNWNVLRGEGLIRGLKSALGSKARVTPWNAMVHAMDLTDSDRIQSEEMRRLADTFLARISGKEKRAPSDLTRAMISTVRSHIVRENHFTELRPFFKQALSDKSVTAWVGADATVTIAAARFLEKRGIRIPEELSLIAIHDRMELADRGITGLDIQRDRHAYLAAHCLLGDIPVRKNSRGAILCPTRVVDRGSVGRNVS